MTDLIKSVRQFTEAIGCTTDQFNVRQTALYIGLQLEELAEKLDAIANPSDKESGIVVIRLISIVHQLNDASSDFKGGRYDPFVKRADRAAMLDADIDLAWVTIGSAFSQGADVEGAAGEVARANMSKLVECDACKGNAVVPIEDDEAIDCAECNGLGLVAIKDANGKVKKPEGWTPPNIEPFVCKEGGAE